MVHRSTSSDSDIGRIIMYAVLDDKTRILIKSFTPWIIGTEGADKNFAPIFKKDTPKQVLEDYNRFLNMRETQ